MTERELLDYVRQRAAIEQQALQQSKNVNIDYHKGSLQAWQDMERFIKSHQEKGGQEW